MRPARGVSIHLQMALGTGSTPTHTASSPTFPIPASARVHPGATGASKATTPTKAVAPATTTTSTSTAPGLSTPTTSAPGTASTPTISAPTAGGAVGNPATQSTSSTRTSAPAHSKHSESLSTAAIVAAIVAAVLVLGCIAWALARRRAFEPHWLLSLRHAMAEAGFRASATWAEFADWAKLGR